MTNDYPEINAMRLDEVDAALSVATKTIADLGVWVDVLRHHRRHLVATSAMIAHIRKYSRGGRAV